MSKYVVPDEAPDAWQKARDQLVSKGFQQRGTSARKKREKKVRSAADGRKLAQMGRTEQLNVRVTPEVKKLVARAAEIEGIFMGDLIERLILDALGGETE